MKSDKKRTIRITILIVALVFATLQTTQAVAGYPTPDLAWHNPVLYGDVTDVAIGDLTGNGVADVAYVDTEYDTLSAVYGINGTNYWQDVNMTRGYSIAIGDVDGDDKNEVVAGGLKWPTGNRGIFVFEDNGTEKFVYNTRSEYVKDIELGDVDNDGVDDIVACNNGVEGWIYAFNGTDGGNLTGWPQGFDESIEDIAIGNLDENPGLDIAAISHTISPPTLYVFNSTGDFMWINTTVYGRSVEIGNVDNDPEEEVVIGDMNSNNVYVYNGSTGTLEYSFDTIKPPSEVELGDLDGDTSDLEIAVITGYAVDDTIYAIDIDAAGQVNEMWSFSIDWTPYYYGEALAIGDVDGDNKNEVIAASDSDGYKVWAFDGLDSNGDGMGDVVWMYDLASHPNDVEVGDVDDDGDMDVIVGTNHEGVGSVYALFTKESAPEVPTLTPIGLTALVSLLSAIAAVAIVRKRR